MTDKDFKRAIDDATLGEQYIKRKLSTKYPHVKTATEIYGNVKFDDYDLITNYPNGITYELKVDTMSRATKQIAIEYECSGLSSGINKTKADWWLHIYYDHTKEDWQLGVVKTGILRGLTRYGKMVGGGFGGYSKMYLLPVWWVAVNTQVKKYNITDEQYKQHLYKTSEFALEKRRIKEAVANPLTWYR